jgi:hypothetical protein
LETIEELEVFLAELTVDGFRSRLKARGEARSIIMHEGTLPEDAPIFAESIETDLTEYGFSLLRAALALKEANGNVEIWRKGFTQAGNIFESLVQNGSPEGLERGFYRVIGAASYHLGNYSALAFSMATQRLPNSNLTPYEDALLSLILRDLKRLKDQTRRWLLDESNSDQAIANALELEEIDPDDAINIIATTTIFRSLAFFEFALQTGVTRLTDESKLLLQQTISLTNHANAVSIWWISKLIFHLVDDLWASSLHQTLPLVGPEGEFQYLTLRKMFISTLYSRTTTEVELWPSQIEAAQRAVDITDDLVVALPTSAGKTRIAEITALMTLSIGKRVLIVTPLRALSAQTERSFRKTFAPLGFSVSSLYGAMSMAIGDGDALRNNNIVIATPEKLDFALRNDTSIINDVGLVVLDEGHLIGPSDREIRYENLVQRLLKRPDHSIRRIVCLSAILPEGDQLDDLTSWIRSDVEGTPIQSRWRPTRQRFGTLMWMGNSGRLRFDLEQDGPFIRHFIPQAPAIAPRRRPFPSNNQEFTLAAAWKFSEQGKRTLIFCTQRDHVENYAKAVVDLNRRGFLASQVEDNSKLDRARAVGNEWLGHNHPVVQCLSLGIAIHHGRLPSPFLRELEALLAQGAIKIIIASPTLAQGLNLNAAVLLIPSLYRAGSPILGEEFANVAGRAGRAFVDLEGLVLHTMFEPANWRLDNWRTLVNSARCRSLSSGIISIVSEVINRLSRTEVFQRADAMEYLSNTQEAWFPETQQNDSEPIESLIERLDVTVLGLIEALDSDSQLLPQLLDEALTGSLWSRQIGRLNIEVKQSQLWVLQARSRLIWNKSSSLQRRYQFAMGVGLEAGLALDAIADELNMLLTQADLAAAQTEQELLINSLIGLGERLFLIRPFVPDIELPLNWPELLSAWVSGAEIDLIGLENIRVIEEAFIYRLVWAIEAIRMKRQVVGVEEPVLMQGSASAALEAGVPNMQMAMLVRAGLPSRVAAINSINETTATFTNSIELRLWMDSPEVILLSTQENWPTAETMDIWRQFRTDILTREAYTWTSQSWDLNGVLNDAFNPDLPGRIYIDDETGEVTVRTPDYKLITGIQQRFIQTGPNILQAKFSNNPNEPTQISRLGQAHAYWQTL